MTIVAALALFGTATHAQTILNADDGEDTVSNGAEAIPVDDGANDRYMLISTVATYILTLLNSEAELETNVADMANIIQASEIDTEAKLVAIITDLATILQVTDIDTEAKLVA